MPMNLRQDLSQFTMNTLSPVFRILSWGKSKYQIANVSLESLDALEKEVVTLRQKDAELSAQNSSLQFLKNENERLKEEIGFKKDSSFKLLAARVIQRDLSTWQRTLIIDRGWSDDPDIAMDQPVITPRGVVGKTGVVGKYATKVVLLVDENCKISAQVEGSRAQGIVMGAAGSHEGEPICKMTFIPRDATILLQARVFTSGLGGMFPQGLLIGTVKAAPALSAEHNFGLFREAVIEPAVDLNDLKELFVLVGVKHQ